MFGFRKPINEIQVGMPPVTVKKRMMVLFCLDGVIEGGRRRARDVVEGKVWAERPSRRKRSAAAVARGGRRA
jgi:hypothetical protein